MNENLNGRYRMKDFRKLLFLILMCLVPLAINAQSYQDGWKEVDEAARRDLPRNELKALDKIIKKATRQKNYGQLMSAELVKLSVRRTLEPDSVKGIYANYRKTADLLDKKNPALAAIYYAVVSDKKKALAHLDVLAATRHENYVPLVNIGVSSSIFNHDLLHVIGFYFNAYDEMSAYYQRKGNKLGAFIVEGLGLIKKGDYRQVDALIKAHPEFDESVWLAGKRAERISKSIDRGHYADSVVRCHPHNRYVNILRNQVNDCMYPRANISISRTILSPLDSIKMDITTRNIHQLKFEVRRLINDTTVNEKVEMEQTININVDDVFQSIKQNYSLPSLPIGWYEIRAIGDDYQASVAKCQVKITALYLLATKLPGNKYRMVVVDRKTGKPVSKASIHTYMSSTNKPGTVYTCDEKGEVLIDAPANYNTQIRYAPVLGRDTYCPAELLYPSFYSNVSAENHNGVDNIRCHTMTDRAIYRPGQKVHLAATVYSDTNKGKMKTIENIPIGVIVSNADDQEVDTLIANTDAYGTIAVEYQLPKNAKTGHWSLMVTNDVKNFAEDTESFVSTHQGVYIHKRFSQNIDFSVEEYKRPTFTTEWISPKEAYCQGDTITLKGKASTFADNAVQGARVVYSVGNNSKDTTITDNKGIFSVRVPIHSTATYEWGRRVTVRATVTDVSGESHEAQISLPVRKSPARLSVMVNDGGETVTQDTLRIMITRKNLSDQPIAGSAFWYLVPQGKTTKIEAGDAIRKVKANQTFTISTRALQMHTGDYILYAICEGDTSQTDIRVVNLADKHLCTSSDIWLYADHVGYKSMKDAIRVQYGSSRKNVTFFYTLASSRQILKKEQLSCDSSLQVLTIPYDKSMGDLAILTLAMVKDGKVYQMEKQLTGPRESEPKLQVTWSTFRDKLQPGEKETWKMNVRYPNGKPADAQLTGTMFDQALDYLKEYYTMDVPTFTPYITSSWSGLTNHYDSDHLFHYFPYHPESDLSFSAFRRNLMQGRVGLDDIALLKSADEGKYDAGKVGLIMGVVTDMEGNPLIGVTVKSKDNMKSAITDVNGQFKIASQHALELIFSFVDFMSEKIVAQPGASLRVRLRESGNRQKDAAVVGYGVRKKNFAVNRAVSADVMNAAMAADNSIMIRGSKLQVESAATPASSNHVSEEILPSVSPRTNFSELAFWQPQLVTDKKGRINLTFTLPESITAWRFIGWAHDKHMRTGWANAMVKAQKAFVVQPNMPRFMRRGDSGELVSRIVNTSEQNQKGTIVMQLLDPATEEVIYEEKKPFVVNAQQTTSAVFTIDLRKSDTIKDGVICKIVAATADGTADGEQHYLAILPNKEIITKSMAVRIKRGETATVPVEKLFGKNASQRKLIIETTENPIWYAVQALGGLTLPKYEDAFSQLSSFYANSLIAKIGSQFDNDSIFIKMLGTAANPDTLRHRIDEAASKLGNLQHNDGRWSWFSGMPGNDYMTIMIAEQLVHLNQLIGAGQSTRLPVLTASITNAETMLRQAMPVIDKCISDEAKTMRKKEAEERQRTKGRVKSLPYIPYEMVNHALYVRAMAGGVESDSLKSDIDYLMSKIIDRPDQLTIYGKAILANVLDKRGEKQYAREFLESIRQYSVKTPMMGVYFDTSKAHSSWYDYKLPTVSMALEAFHKIAPSDTAMLVGMQTYLLEEKRTQEWDTQINSVNAIYALLLDNMKDMHESEGVVHVAMDGKSVAMGDATAIVGFCKTELKEPKGKMLTIQSDPYPVAQHNKSIVAGMSWGSVYAQFEQPVADIDASFSSGFTISRRLEFADSTKTPTVGDKVREVIIIHAERNFDYVRVTSNHAASLEPVKQLSGYDWRFNCYVSPYDSHTDYFFNTMPKGDYTLTTEYYIDRKGEYQNGSCSVQSVYAPVFKAYASQR